MGARAATKRLLGRWARATLLRPGREWRVPFGIGHGLRLLVESEVPLHRYVGSTEAELARHVRRFARRGAVCFDVGGYDGYYALLLARRSRRPVWCFEWDPTRLEHIRLNLALNPALASKVNVVATYIAHESRESPSTDTLDQLVFENGLLPPDFVMIDVEGAEALVLSGASRLLREHGPHLIVETHSKRLSAECLALLHAAGYQSERVPQRPAFRENRGSDDNAWIVASPRGR